MDRVLAIHRGGLGSNPMSDNREIYRKTYMCTSTTNWKKDIIFEKNFELRQQDNYSPPLVGFALSVVGFWFHDCCSPTEHRRRVIVCRAPSPSSSHVHSDDELRSYPCKSPGHRTTGDATRKWPPSRAAVLSTKPSSVQLPNAVEPNNIQRV